MKLENSLSRVACGAALAALAGCGSIGEGSTIQSLQLYLAPVGSLEQGALVDADLPTEKLRMFDCFCSNLDALGIFTNGTISSNFRYRVTFTSDNPAVLEVMNTGDALNSLCPIVQQGPGLLIPKMAGTATITAEFVGLRDSLTVEVAGTSENNFTLAPVDANNLGALAVGTTLPLALKVLLDGRTRQVNGNVTSWDFETPDEDVATISASGIRGIGTNGGAPLTARANFGACLIQPKMPNVRVGEIVAPMALSEEADFRPAPSDQLLAANSNEFLKITADLDYTGDGATDAQQDLSGDSSLSFTDSCTLRSYVANGNGSSTLTDCGEAASTACTNTTPTCSSTMTSCTDGMTACRLEAASMSLDLLGSNRITALSDDDAPTIFTATFPRTRGTTTTLAAAIDEFVTTLTVTELRGYPTTLPWDAVIGSGAGAEVVRVTAMSGTTLTVTRGIGGTIAAAHAAGDAFAQRGIVSGTLPITADGRELTGFTLEPAATTLAAFGTLQLNALGTFDVAEAPGTDPRTQRVTRLSTVAAGSPRVIWSSSDSSVAFVGSGSGLVTAVSPCGGVATIRARADTSTNTLTASFDPDSTADDDACTGNTGLGDPLCHQTSVCVQRVADPTLFGVTCADPPPPC